jgi:hypothetical protein
MAILLLVLLALAGLVVGDAIVENTTTTTVTLAGQEMGGLTLGGWLTAFAALGFLAAYILLGMLAAARRNRVRRRAVRSSEREMADRVAELERENSALREQDNGDRLEHREPAVRDDTLVDTAASRRLHDRSHDGAESGIGRGSRDRSEPSPTGREHSPVDDYPPGPTHDGQRDRWPEPTSEQSPQEKPPARR